MGRFGGTALKLVQTFLYAFGFCCAGIILSVYSYFLSVLADRNLPIAAKWKAVEGMSGAAVLYLIFAILLTCFLGGKAFFAFLAIVLNILFCGAFVAIAILTRDGAHSCSGNVKTPLGSGSSNARGTFGQNGFGSGNGENVTYSIKLGTACRLNSAAFAVAILGAILFLISALIQVFIARNHRKEKRYGPSPANNYSFGRSTNHNMFRRKHKSTGPTDPAVAEAGTGSLMADRVDVRPSHETGYTGSTMAPNIAAYDSAGKPMTGDYHTAPTGTHAAHASPYGYDNTRPATNF